MASQSQIVLCVLYGQRLSVTKSAPQPVELLNKLIDEVSL